MKRQHLYALAGTFCFLILLASGCGGATDTSNNQGSNTQSDDDTTTDDSKSDDTTNDDSNTDDSTSNDTKSDDDTSTSGSNEKMTITTSPFGKTKAGDDVKLYTCTNDNGLVLKMIDYGAIVVSLNVPDKDGKLANINLGFDKIDGYLERHPYFGATVGRYCNRIAKGKFTIGDQEYTLAANNETNHLHGGVKGFDAQMWNADEVKTDSGVGLKFNRVSPDGEEGYPGNLDVTVVYTLTNDNELKVEFNATTDKDTPVNLTNHNYWNLGGAGSGTVLEHELEIMSGKFLAVDDGLIPTGAMTDVKDTPLDFTSPHKIGERIKEIDADPVGYDHCYVLRNQDSSKLELAARIKEPTSGRIMEIYTTQPGVQLYSGNFLDGSEGGNGFKQYEGFCLETQHYPDSPNQPDFPTTILKPGETFSQTTVHKFHAE